MFEDFPFFSPCRRFYEKIIVCRRFGLLPHPPLPWGSWCSWHWCFSISLMGAVVVLTRCQFHFKQGATFFRSNCMPETLFFFYVCPFIAVPEFGCPRNGCERRDSRSAPEARLHYELGTANGLVDLISIMARNPSARLKVIGDSTGVVSLIYGSKSNWSAFLQKKRL